MEDIIFIKLVVLASKLFCMGHLWWVYGKFLILICILYKNMICSVMLIRRAFSCWAFPI